jgi:hypothetical protein
MARRAIFSFSHIARPRNASIGLSRVPLFSSASGHHPAYDLGMKRLSCVFCVFAPRKALLIAGEHNPELLNDYVAAEKRMGHTFRVDQSLVEIQNTLNERGR